MARRAVHQHQDDAPISDHPRPKVPPANRLNGRNQGPQAAITTMGRAGNPRTSRS